MLEYCYSWTKNPVKLIYYIYILYNVSTTSSTLGDWFLPFILVITIYELEEWNRLKFYLLFETTNSYAYCLTYLS